jgi:predicted RNase H-like HicB family nuclease
MRLTVETEREDDGRWLAEIPELPGVMAYADSADNAARACRALALEVLANRLREGERIDSVQFVAA